LAATARMISGWGRYPVAPCHVETPDPAAEIGRLVSAAPSLIARGNGRSYGDASLNEAATLDMCRHDRVLAFDRTTGLITCEAGVMLSDLVACFVRQGFFPPVTPGTRYVTVGGMIASDVHGKNHHRDGSFGAHVAWIDLVIADGSLVRCGPGANENADLFWATCGGMGLTGVIVRAAFTMPRIETSLIRQEIRRAPDIDAVMEEMESSLAWTYSVAWIDCLASGRNLGRSALMLGEHAQLHELDAARRAQPLTLPQGRDKAVPFDFPSIALNRLSVSAFNALYYRMQRPGLRLVPLTPYFYPLDAIQDWNRIYGRAGFAQHQCALPMESARYALIALLSETAKAGQGSFLAVLKRFGPGNPAPLSFPMEGYTLALDFPVNPTTLALMDRMDRIVADHGGRLYLAKDSRSESKLLSSSYKQIDRFRAVRGRYDPNRRFRSLLSDRLGI
jgi:decaprenylphospho-beta-D-ribofuranose 2-oxidase